MDIKKYTHIVWDFNGTILDDVQTGIDCVNVLLEKRGLKRIPDKEYYRDVFGFPIIDYYSRLGFDFEKEDYHYVAVEWVLLYKKECLKASLNKGVTEALEKIKNFGIPQYILSATETGMLKEQIEYLGIGRYFNEISGLDNIHVGSKTSLGKNWAERVKPERVLIIGDTSHDYETALCMGADCILYSGGHMKPGALEKCPCRIINDFSELFI